MEVGVATEDNHITWRMTATAIGSQTRMRVGWSDLEILYVFSGDSNAIEPSTERYCDSIEPSIERYCNAIELN